MQRWYLKSMNKIDKKGVSDGLSTYRNAVNGSRDRQKDC